MEPKEYFSELSSVAPRRFGPPSHALGPFSVLGVKESQQKDSKAAAATASSAAAAFSGMSVLKGITGKSNQQTPAPGIGGGTAVAGGGDSEDNQEVNIISESKRRPAVL